LVLFDTTSGNLYYANGYEWGLVNGGGRAPGGANGEIQFNNGGSFGGSPNLFWNNGSEFLGIGTNSPTAAISLSGSDPTINNVTTNGSITIASNGTGHLNFDSNGGIVLDTPLVTLENPGGVTELLFAGNTGGDVGFQAPSNVTTPVIWTLPGSDGTANQVLQTNGSAVLSWVTLTISQDSGSTTVSWSGPWPGTTNNTMYFSRVGNLVVVNCGALSPSSTTSPAANATAPSGSIPSVYRPSVTFTYQAGAFIAISGGTNATVMQVYNDGSMIAPPPIGDWGNGWNQFSFCYNLQ
jgi:hypothetical protein